MNGKMIKADPKAPDLKTINIGSLIAIFFIIAITGFMIFQNLKITEERSQSQIIATAFAEGIQSMCADEEVGARHLRMCSIAQEYADKEHYLGIDPSDIPTNSPGEIESVLCKDGETVIRYSDGVESEVDIQCDTDS